MCHLHIKGKKVRSFTVSFKLRSIAHAKVHGNRSAARKYDVDEHRVREWRAKKECISSLNLTDGGENANVLMAEEENLNSRL